ncbi:hypothetical protein [Streptomyces scabiei]|uniref:hypothetical protein n=1 Tax=Streptomyces scabiei TaxID=1930 RepID=UPI0038F7910C
MRIRMHAITTLTAALVALTGCSGDNAGSETADTKQPGSSAASSTPAAETPDAESVVKSLAESIGDAQPATVYTAASDPNNLLGRPGGYTSKADWTDKRAKPKFDDEVQNGGSVEVYTDPAEAEERATFVAETLDKMKIFGTEYHYIKGGILLRVSGALTPEQAAEYEKALDRLT